MGVANQGESRQPRMPDSYILKIPAVCSSQIDGKMYQLGTYDDEADTARAFDRVASVLCRPLNLLEEDESEIIGPRSEGANQAVAQAVKAAETFMGRAKPHGSKWRSQMKVSQGS